MSIHACAIRSGPTYNESFLLLGRKNKNRRTSDNPVIVRSQSETLYNFVSLFTSQLSTNSLFIPNLADNMTLYC